MTKRAWLLATTMFAISACGTGSISEPGRGSGTLTINAHVQAESRVPNARGSTDYDCELSARVYKAGQAVIGATVEIASGLGTVKLIDDNNNGTYRGVQVGYAGAYTLSAQLGDDYFEGGSLSGPEAHSFETPAVGAQIVYGQPLEVRWSPSGATAASLSTRELDEVAVQDTGAYSVPAGGLKKADPGKTEEERVRVTRSSTMGLSGTAGGSDLSVSVRNEVTLLIVGQ
jgi:hypothetical protein